ncbi:MAG: 2-methylcitrate dehydratase [Elusimicrobia bacterium]|nr:2-methylcitrate dehydratase [Elusimicrobiota bacterium]
MLESTLSLMPEQFRNDRLDHPTLLEAKKRVLDSLACFYGAFDEKPGRLLRTTFLPGVSGDVTLWGTGQRVPAELAAWANGTCVRTLDFNDTYLSKEPCHPSDLLASLWAACEISGVRQQGTLLLRALVLAYEVLCRLCDAHSIRVRGWDHVTYLPIASAVGCSYILDLNSEQTRHAISLAVVGNNALRQTRVGTISDWKASCAAYAARSGLWAARLAGQGFTGPSDIFAGRHGFFNQVSGAFSWPRKRSHEKWRILSTHTKFFPAEHHAQSAIEAAIQLRESLQTRRPGNPLAGSTDLVPAVMNNIRSIIIETFDVAVDIIGSEKEKWLPTTRETADHSLPYLVAVALREGDVNLKQYEQKRFLSADIRALMKKVLVRRSQRYSKMYPHRMPTKVTLVMKGRPPLSAEVLLPKGYAGRPMSWEEVEDKFHRLASPHLTEGRRKTLVKTIARFEKISYLSPLMGRVLKVDP